MQPLLPRLAKQAPWLRDRGLKALNRLNLLLVDYPIDPQPRWGYGKPEHTQLHDLLSAYRSDYEGWLERFGEYREAFGAIDLEPGLDPAEPHWNNRFFSGLDAAALYGFLAERKPQRFVEVGSGISTKFARRAIRDLGLPTTITSIDPHPRAEIDAICDRVIRSPIERADLSLFATLTAGDVVLVDNSHRALQNSDVTVVFLDVLPILAPGVVVGIDDILLPWDYPPEWRYRYYSEQYALAAFLLGGHAGYRIELPDAYVTRDQALARTAAERLRLPIAMHGSTFWMSSIASSSTRS